MHVYTIHCKLKYPPTQGAGICTDQLTMSGVLPSLSLASTLAPALSKTLATAALPTTEAHLISGVHFEPVSHSST